MSQALDRATNPFFRHGADIVAAATINLDTATGDFVHVTGNTGINAITLSDGRERTVFFSGSPILTAGANFALGSNGSIPVSAGDILKFLADGSVVRLVGFIPASQNASLASMLGVPSVASLQGFSAAQKAQARTNMAAVLRGHLWGLTLSTAGSSATFAAAAGEAADSTAADLMVLPSAMSKTAGAWALGSGNGALDTGSIVANTFYHVHQIKRPSDGAVDVAISTNPAAPVLGTNIPAAFSLSRRIGTLCTDSASKWLLFHQFGDEFLWDVPIGTVSVTNLSTTPTLYTLGVPTGIQVNALIRAAMSSATANVLLLINSADEAVSAVNTPAGQASMVNPAVGVAGLCTLNLRTNTSAQVRAVSQAASTSLWIVTYGWVDTRGRLQ
jgi:hypothetical protein